MAETLKLESRTVIELQGEDSLKFLQGLITNDTAKICESGYTYAFILNPQGRFLYDFFIVKSGDSILLDCQKSKLLDILKKLKLYKLKSKVEIYDKSEELKIYYSDSPIDSSSFVDPRDETLGYRTITTHDIPNTCETLSYELRRIKSLIPDADADLIFERSLPLEFGQAALSAVDFNKGCYVGQEVTSRMNWRANIRKKLYLLEFTGPVPIKGEELILDNKKIGIFLGTVANLSLGLLNIEEVDRMQKPDFQIDDKTIKLIR
jgi:folate-binding protein YgfZ